MGSPEAGVYLANAWVAAAAAVAGELVHPEAIAVRVEGVALVVPGDNIDTDVMYPGAYLNVEDPEQMAQYLFEGFDPTLRERLVDGTILVVGANFGIGSSREHVPLAMKGERDPRRRRPELRADLLPQLRQPRPRDRRVPGGGRRRARRLARSSSTPREQSRSTVSPSTRLPAPPLVLELGAAGGLVDWTASRITR